jgi:hypothetical protein
MTLAHIIIDALAMPSFVFTSNGAIEVTPFTVWNEEARASLPILTQRWIIFMLATFALGLLFVRDHVAARWMVGAVVVSHLSSAAVILLLGPEHLKVGIIAIEHVIFWTPAALYLLFKGAPTGRAPLYRVWRYAALSVAAISLIFDYRDAALFLFTSS